MPSHVAQRQPGPAPATPDRAPVKVLALGVALLAAVGLVSWLAQAAPPEPELAQLATMDDYTHVFVNFTDEVFPLDPLSGEPLANQALGPSDFTLTASDGSSVLVSSVTRQGRGSWELELPAAFVPHELTLEASVGNENGTLVVSEPLPFSAAHYDALVAALVDHVWLDTSTVELPFAQEWLGDAPSLSKLMPDLAPPPEARPTDAALLQHLLNLDGVAGATFDGASLVLTFDGAGPVGAQELWGTVALPGNDTNPFALTLSGAFNASVSLEGGLRFDVDTETGDVAAVDDPAGPHAMHLAADAAPFDATGRIGLAGVHARAFVNATATLAAGGATGEAELRLQNVSVDLSPVSVARDPILWIEWPDLSELTACEGAATLVDGLCEDGDNMTNPIDNVVVLRDDFNATLLGVLARFTMDDVLRGLAWLPGWLDNAEKSGMLGQEVPLVGRRLGELANVSRQVADIALAVKDTAALAGGAEGGVSAQDLVDVCGRSVEDFHVADYVDKVLERVPGITEAQKTENVTRIETRLAEALALCNGVLSEFTITSEGIEYTLEFDSSFVLFDGAAPQLDLDLGGDLDGFELGVGSTDITAEADLSLALTFGFKTADDATLGLTPTSPQVASRFYLRTGDVATVTVDVSGTVTNASARLGFLDFALEGDAKIAPVISLGLNDTNETLTLVDLAAAADARDLGRVLSLGVDGPIAANFSVANPLVLRTGPARVQVLGPVSALGNGPNETLLLHNKTAPTWAYNASRINIGHSIGASLNVKNLTASQVIAMVASFARQMGDLTGTDLMSKRVPFVDVTFSEAVGFSEDVALLAEGVAARDPQDLSSLAAALQSALGAAGMPDRIVVGATPEELTLSLSMTKEVNRTYPFSFASDDLGFAPVDGGASLNATARVVFEPTIGILLNWTGVENSTFVRGAAPRFELVVDSDVYGSVYLGPATAGIQGTIDIGTAAAPARLGVLLGDPDGDGRTTIAELRTILNSTNAHLFSTTYGGAIAANVSVGVTGLPTRGTINVTGDLSDLTNLTVRRSNLSLANITLDLRTLITGTIEVARFVGRALENSDVLQQDLPLLGDSLRTVPTVGADLRAAADKMDAVWRGGGDAVFRNTIEAELEAILCPSTPPDTSTCVETRLVPPGAVLANATAFEVVLMLAKESSPTMALSGGLQDDSFALDLTLQPTVTIGYQTDLVLGIDTTHGFYVRAGDDPGNDVLQLYASFDATATGIDGAVGGIAAKIDDLHASVGGTLGPDGNAGGFALSIKEKVPLRNLSNRARGADSVVPSRIEANIALDANVTLAAQDLVVLKVPVAFDARPINGTFNKTLTLGSAAHPIRLDVQSIVDNVAEPALEALSDFKPAEKKFNPFAQDDIHAALTSEIPTLSSTLEKELGRLAYGLGYVNEWQVVSFLIHAGETYDALVLLQSGGDLELGYVEVLPTYRYVGPRLDPSLQPGFGNISRILDTANPRPNLDPRFVQTCAPNCTPPAIVSFPILKDPSSAVSLVLKGELRKPVTFVEIAPPKMELGPKVGFTATLLELDAGFVKGHLHVVVEGFIGVALNTGFGIDSSGLQTGNFADGFYLIDRAGNEVAFVARVGATVDGYFSVFGDFASIRFRGSGGFVAEVGLDLYDESPALPAPGRGDGKLHVHEIRQIADAHVGPFGPGSEPLCMFQLRAQVYAYLAFSGTLKLLGITVFSESFSERWDILDETLACPLQPVAAHLDGRQVNLNGGVFADKRFDGRGDVAEGFTVSVVGSNVVVHSHLPGVRDSTFPLASVDRIFADLGAGNDAVTIDGGVDIPAKLLGGVGNDGLLGGSGDDEISGGPGSDTLGGGRGENVVEGDADDDALHAGGERDALFGGGGANRYVVPQAWGDTEVVDEGGRATLDLVTTTPVAGEASFDEGELTQGAHRLRYAVSEVLTILGGAGNDTLTVNRYAPEGLHVDLRGGNDTVTVPFAGVARTIRVTDASNEATLVGIATEADDEVFFRARCAVLDAGPCVADPNASAEVGFVALVTPTGAVERVSYNDSLSLVEFRGLGGDNVYVLDDVAAPLHLFDGDGAATIQVGQIFGNPASAPYLRRAPFVEPGNEVRARGVEARGALSLGVSHPTRLEGGGGNDLMTVYSNVAPLYLGGGEGDDTFVLRAFILNGTVLAAGGDGRDRFEYVPNDDVEIDGGPGFNTLVIIGTELSDGYVIDAAAVRVCPQYNATEIPLGVPVHRFPNATATCAIGAKFVNIQSMIVHGLAGNDAFWVRSTSPTVALRLFGGLHGAVFLVGDHGNLTGIQGPVHVDGEADPEFDASVLPPRVLPGEDATPSGPGLQKDYDELRDLLVVDGSAANTTIAGEMTSQRIFGLGMGGDVELLTSNGTRVFPGGATFVRASEVRVLLGEADDALVVHATPTFAPPVGVASLVGSEVIVMGGDGDDDIVVRTIDGPTKVHTGHGGDTVRVGSGAIVGGPHPLANGTLAGIADRLTVRGGEDADDHAHLILDASGSPGGERVDVRQGLVTQLAMPRGIAHADVDLVEVFLTSLADVANVRGTSTATILRGLDGDDRYFVSDQAALGVADATPPLLDGRLGSVAGALHLDAGDGVNLIMASDRASLVAAPGVFLTNGSIDGLAPAAITYEANGTFAGGITVWTGAEADDITVVSTRNDGDPTTLAWEGRAGGVAPRTITTLNTRAGDDLVFVDVDAGDGLFVVNAGDGDDTIDGSASSLGFVAFGGDGNDDVTTGAGDDLVFGDVGRVEWCAGASLAFAYHGGVSSCGAGLETLAGDEDVANVNDGLARSVARMYSLSLPAGATDGLPYRSPSGASAWAWGFHDRIQTGAGDDVAWGGAGSDLVASAGGRNALLGDHGEVWRFSNATRGGATTIRTNDGMIDHVVLNKGIAYVVDVRLPGEAGNDVILGRGDSWIFAGGGDDIVNGDTGDDVVWGGDGHDLLWGGDGADRIYGGAGEDIVDLKLGTWQAGIATRLANASWWDLAWLVAPVADTDGNATTDNGDDLVYGGRDRDSLQGDRGVSGPRPGDRLLDWSGTYNVYFVCRGPYGAGTVLRDASPSVVTALTRMAEADGAFSASQSGSSGWLQLALAVDEHARANRGAPHADHPGNRATC